MDNEKADQLINAIHQLTNVIDGLDDSVRSAVEQLGNIREEIKAK